MEVIVNEYIDKLNRQAELPSDKYRATAPRMLTSTAVKLYQQAVDFQFKGQEETSYISFMKYLNLVSLIRKSPDYRKDEKYFNLELGVKNIQNAIRSAESLQKELIRKCSNKMEEGMARKKLAQLDLKEQLENESKEEVQQKDLSMKNGKKQEVAEKKSPDSDKFISSWELDTIIKQRSTSFIIFDVRSREDFQDSHINHTSCFSIPEDLLKPGLSAATLYKSLPLDSKVAWPKRLNADVIVVVDWFGKKLPGTAAYALEEIFTKWDPSSSYSGVIKLLGGGYDDWLARFPLQTTNPRATLAKPAATLSSPLNMVLDFEYPNFDDEMNPVVEKLAHNTTQPTVNRNTKPLAESNAPEIARAPSPVSTVPPQVNPSSSFVGTDRAAQAPQVDRNLKKGALLKYLEDEEQLVEKSMATAQESLKREEEWNRIRQERESISNSEMAAQIQLREEQLLKVLQKLKADNDQQAREIESLKRDKEEYERRNELHIEQEKRSEEEDRIQKRIRQKNEEKAAMDKEVERLRLLRRKQEQETERAQQLERERVANEQEEERRRLKDEEAKRRRAEDLKREQDEARTRSESLRRDVAFKGKTNLTRLKDESPSSNFSFGSKMNRSHSTPDLAQAIQDEAASATTRTPQVERSLKPLTPNRTQLIARPDLSKNRNFNPVYGTMGRGLTGLKNLGNTCYMNSILQCISNCALLTNIFVDGSYRQFLNPNNKVTRGDISDEVSSTLKALWSGQYRSISCKDLKNAIGRYKSAFCSYEQQDSHEFLTILIDWMHEELNEIREKKPLKEQNNHNILDEDAASMAWKDYARSNKSIIVQLFGGQQRSCLRCSSCGEESVTFEPFFNLSLPIPQNKSQCSIKECFQLYTKPEQISGWSCPFCKNKKGASKTIDIWKLPPVLVVHLQRFYNDGLWRKRLTMVDFNVNELDLDDVVKSKRASYYKRFKLFAVSNHYGTMDAGHYTAYCNNAQYNKWFKFDDQDVMEINGNEVRSAAAYILFYTAIDYQAPPIVGD